MSPTPPEPAPPPKRETFADWIGRCDDLPDDLTAAVEQDRSPYEVEFKRRVRDHGGHITSLRELERFTRERWPVWCDPRHVYNAEKDYTYWRDGIQLCRFLWSGWLEYQETDA